MLSGGNGFTLPTPKTAKSRTQGLFKPTFPRLRKVPLDKNPNGLILGTPGSGKSFAAKREIANAFLIITDDIAVCDPEGEYFPLVKRFHGQVIKISPTSGDFINPMDINLNYSDDESPLSLKSDFILSLCELVVGGREGLQPIEKTVVDRWHSSPTRWKTATM